MPAALDGIGGQSGVVGLFHLQSSREMLEEPGLSSKLGLSSPIVYADDIVLSS